MAKSKKTKKAEPVVTQEQLVAVAEDFNTFMVEEGEEGIDTELEYDDLLAEVTEAAGDLVDDDVITQETADTLEALGIEHVAQVGESEVEDEEEDLEEEDLEEEDLEEEEDEDGDLDEPEEEDEDPDGESIEEMIERAKKNKIPVPPTFRKDKEKLAAYLEKKMPATPAKATGKKGAKAETKPAEKKGGKPAGKPAAEKKEKKEKATGRVFPKDKFGFRPGCKKSIVMEKISKGGASYEALKNEFGGQVNWAIKGTLERSGIKVEVDKKGIAKIVK